MRFTGGIDSSIVPEAKAGRFGTAAPASPVPDRSAAPFRSTCTCTLGVQPSSIGMRSVCELPLIEKRCVRSRPSRRSVSSPSAGENGASTRISAVSPGW